MRFENEMEQMLSALSDEETAELLANLNVGEEDDADKAAVMRIRNSVQNRVSAENVLSKNRKIRRIVMSLCAAAACLAVVLSTAYIWKRSQLPPIDVVMTSTEPMVSIAATTTEYTGQNIASTHETAKNQSEDEPSGNAVTTSTVTSVTTATENEANSEETSVYPQDAQTTLGTTQTTLTTSADTDKTAVMTTTTSAPKRTRLTTTSTTMHTTPTTSTTKRTTPTTSTTKRTTPTTSATYHTAVATEPTSTTAANVIGGDGNNGYPDEPSGGADPSDQTPTEDKVTSTTETTTTEETTDIPRMMAEYREYPMD